MPKRGLESLEESAVSCAKRHKPNPEEALLEVPNITIWDEIGKQFAENDEIPEDDLPSLDGVNRFSGNEVTNNTGSNLPNEAVREIFIDATSPAVTNNTGSNLPNEVPVPEILADVTLPAVTNNTGFNLPNEAVREILADFNLSKVVITMQMLSRCGRNQTYLPTNFFTEGIGKIRKVNVTMHLLDCLAPQINDRFTISVEDLPVSEPRIPNFHFLLSLHDNQKTALTKTITLPVIWGFDNTFEFSFYIHVQNRNLNTRRPLKSKILFRFNDTIVQTISPIARSHHFETELRENEQTNPVVVDVVVTTDY